MAAVPGAAKEVVSAPKEPEGLGESHASHDQIAILDFGSQYSHLIARRIRELGVYCEMHSCLIKAEDLFSEPKGASIKGVIFSGGPFSVYEDGAPHVDENILKIIAEKKLPLLGICYGFQELTQRGGGKVEAASEREYGHAVLDFKESASEARLLADVLAKAAASASESDGAGTPAGVQVWMSHGDKVTALAKGWETIASTRDCGQAVAWCPSKRQYGIQFHPEVSHTPCGLDILRGFVIGECTCSSDWSMAAFLDEAVKEIQEKVGEEAHVIGAVSGGVDSTVAAVLMNRAIGKRFHAVMVDNGLLRLDEAAQCKQRLGDECGVDITVVDASDRFLDGLAGVEDPERKRKIIGNTFIHVFEAEAEVIDRRIREETGAKAAAGQDGDESLVKFLLQGTLYPDVIESVSFKGPSCSKASPPIDFLRSATIKSHHNVGGLLDHMKLGLIEPLRELFKDEVRALGMEMGLPRSSVFRHPFPGPGLAIRVLGKVSKESCDILRLADKIYLDELHASGEYDKIGQAFAVLLPCKSVGVMGDGRTYEQVVALRAAATSDFMTADWHRMPYEVLAKASSRIINEVKGVNRVCYDVSSKPPATIEWE